MSNIITDYLKKRDEEEKSVDIDELLNDILIQQPKGERSINFQFQNTIEIKDLFEILLKFFTDICKLYYSDTNGIVDLEILSNDDLNFIRKYFKSIGFDFNVESYNYFQVDNKFIDELQNNKYNKITINNTTQIDDLYFVLKCRNIIYKIKFFYL